MTLDPFAIRRHEIVCEYTTIDNTPIPKETIMRHTPVDLYVKEYLLRAILVAFDNKDTPDDVWDMPLVSVVWKMYCDGFSIEFIKENTDTGFLVTVFKNDVRVNRRDDENGISTKLSDEANEVVRRYIRSCYKPTQSPATGAMAMAIKMFAGKEDIIPDVSLRVFKEYITHTLIMHGITQDRNPHNYIGLARPDKIVLTHNSGEVYTIHHRHQNNGWEILYLDEWQDCAMYLHDEYSKRCTKFCDMLKERPFDNDDHFVFL